MFYFKNFYEDLKKLLVRDDTPTNVRWQTSEWQMSEAANLGSDKCRKNVRNPSEATNKPNPQANTVLTPPPQIKNNPVPKLSAFMRHIT